VQKEISTIIPWKAVWIEVRAQRKKNVHKNVRLEVECPLKEYGSETCWKFWNDIWWFLLSIRDCFDAIMPYMYVAFI